jgi:hypothetical protein
LKLQNLKYVGSGVDLKQKEWGQYAQVDIQYIFNDVHTIINIFYFNCAFSKLICTNLCKQSVSHNTPLIELGHVLVTLFLI